MVRLPPSNVANQQAGLTLIEVLVALAIIAIALTAIIKASSQSIRSTGYLRHKTMASWVGESVMNQVQAGVIQLPADQDADDNVVTLLGEEWHWWGHSEATANTHIKKLTVNVSDSKEHETSLLTLESYQYVP